MKITDVRVIPIESMGVAPPKGVGNVLVKPASIFYEPQANRVAGWVPGRSRASGSCDR